MCFFLGKFKVMIRGIVFDQCLNKLFFRGEEKVFILQIWRPNSYLSFLETRGGMFISGHFKRIGIRDWRKGNYQEEEGDK